MSRVVLITGASAGIGRRVAQMLAEAGNTVYVNARRAAKLQTLADEFPEGRVHPVPGDLTDRQFRAGLIDQVVSDAGRIDVLINNAGFGDVDKLEDVSTETIRTLYELNVIALIELTRSAVTVMKEQASGGRIVNVSSLVAFLPVPYMALYNSSKHAVNGFTETLRHELADTDVTVSAVCPGQVDTQFGDSAFKSEVPDKLRGEPAERVARGIVRTLDKNRRWLFPTLQAWFIHLGWICLPWLFRLVMRTLVRSQMRKLMAER